MRFRRRAPLGLALALLVAWAGCPRVPAEVRCNADGDCGDGERCALGFCVDGATGDAGGTDDDVDGGTGIPDAGVACDPPLHDGGDGSCLPGGECAAGFSRFFIDGDGDGVGGSTRSDACAAAPLPGESGSSDDCNDDDGTVSAPQTFFDDADGDGYTSGARDACASTPPAGARAVERLAPLLIGPAGSSSSTGNGGGGGGNAWSDTGAAELCCGASSIADVDAMAGTGTLTVGDLACPTLPRRVEVVRVHLLGALVGSSSSGSESLTTEITLRSAGIAGTTRTSTVDWTSDGVDVILDGAPADWGLDLAPATVCDGSLEVRVAVLPNGSYNDSVGIDFVDLEVDGTDDCAPNDPGAFAEHDRYPDEDGDGQAGGTPSTCNDGAMLQRPDAIFIRDCDDDDDRVFEGQTRFFDTPRQSGSYDYNCDGNEEHRTVSNDIACVDDGSGVCVATTEQRNGPCGSGASADTCNTGAAPPCSITQGGDTIACR